MRFVDLKVGKIILKGAVKEVGAALVAANLYPFGWFGSDSESKKHSKLAHNPRPILLVHGIIHNRSAFITLKRKLERLGWENIYTMNYSTVHGNVLQMVEELSAKVDAIRERTGSAQVDIVAHSLGGIVARTYMSLGDGRGRVRRLITLGTPHQGTQLSFVAKAISRGALDKDLKVNSFLIRLLSKTAIPKTSEVVSIYSRFDWTVVPGKNGAAIGIPECNFKNIELDHMGHIGLLYRHKAFEAIVESILS